MYVWGGGSYHPMVRQLLTDIGVAVVVDKYTHCLMASGQNCGGGIQARIEVCKLDTRTLWVRGVEAFVVVL
jgi:hypothetical protein